MLDAIIRVTVVEKNNKSYQLLDNYNCRFIFFSPFYRLGNGAQRKKATCPRSDSLRNRVRIQIVVIQI